MGEITGVEWAHHTFNGWTGCQALSPACDHCYAKPLVEGRLGRSFADRVRNAASTWAQPRRWNRKALADGERRRVFCSSLADVWDNQVPIDWLVDLLDLIRETPGLDWMLLTKRPMLILKRLRAALDAALAAGRTVLATWLDLWVNERVAPAHVWLGATVENQAMANLRLPFLLDVPAAIHFVSAEPLLGVVNLRAIPRRYDGHWTTFDALDGKWHPVAGVDPGYVGERIRLVIAGGESGPKARFTLPAWLHLLRDDCKATEAAFYFKQWGEWATGYQRMSTGEAVFRQFTDFQHWVNKGGTWIAGGICLDTDGSELRVGADMMRARDEGKFPVTIMHRVGKLKAGRLLDGVQHDGMPTNA